jgi:hypothetical protein
MSLVITTATNLPAAAAGSGQTETAAARTKAMKALSEKLTIL